MYFNLLVCVFRIEVPDLVHVTIGEDEHMLAMKYEQRCNFSQTCGNCLGLAVI